MYARIAARSGTELQPPPARTGGRPIAFALAALLVSAAAIPAAAQGTVTGQTRPVTQDQAQQRRNPNPLASQVRANPNAKMLVQANELVYDYQRDTISAVGKVQIYYDGSVLTADRVTHNRKTNRLNASGNVRYQTKDGNVITTDQIDMDADFTDGFVQSLTVETPERTRMAAARADRSEGNITVLQSGVYTACEPCKENPSKPPLWQVKAARIIHNEAERVIHYENASIEFFGVPIAHVPYFWHPDPTVKRQSGFLIPEFFGGDRTGYGAQIPYFWAIAPDRDLTVSVAPMTRQLGPLVSAEYRQRLVNGAYSIRASGIFQQDPNAFQDPADNVLGVMSPGNRDFRGVVDTKGDFAINKRWNWGWDAAVQTDRFFTVDYSMAGSSGGTEKVSQVYLTGQGDRSYFDMRGMGFTGYSRLDDHSELPYIHPVVDYSYVFGNPILGGEAGFRSNFTSLSRSETDFDPTFNQSSLGEAGVGGTNCITSASPTDCMMRGISGDYTRFSTEFYWKKTITNPWGVVIKPFATARADVATRNVRDDIGGAGVSQFTDVGRDNLLRAMPAVGMEARWPFISVHSWGTQIVEPIGQVVVRPNESKIGQFPNEDAQSLVFDDTNLFAIDKYSGYDRVEGGTRANVGVQYTANIHRYGTVNMLFGQSYQLAGRNSYEYSGVVDPATGQQTGLGLQSGLEDDVSDYVSRIYFQPVGNVSFAGRARFDKDNFDVKRLELETRATWDRLQLATIYARYDSQPLIGYAEKREGIYQTAQLKFHENWSVYGGIRYDLNSDRVDLSMIGLSYVDECFAATFSYVADNTNLTYTKPVHRVMMRMNLRTLGGTGFSTRISDDRTPGN